MRVMQGIPDGGHGAVAKGSSMHDTKLASLKVRLHEPYWILHAGSCEHFFVFTAVRYEYSKLICFVCFLTSLRTGFDIHRTRLLGTL